MNYKIWIFLLLAVSFGTQWCMKKDLLDQCIEMKCGIKKDAFTLFTKKYAPPIELIELIENKENFTGLGDIKQFVFKPYAHYGDPIDRIINAERMRNVIQKYNLNRLDVPKKYLYKSKRHNRWVVFAEKITSTSNSNWMIFFKKLLLMLPINSVLLDLEIVKQLIILAEKTGYSDWANWNTSIINQRPNVLYANGKLIFIDTENISFKFEKIAESRIFPSRFDSLYSFIAKRNVPTKEALDWLNKQSKNSPGLKAGAL